MNKKAESILDGLQRAHPIILLGMHRSGTSLTTRLLKDCGIHMGSKLSINDECVFFRGFNERIFKHAGAGWSTIDPLIRSMGADTFVNKEADHVREVLFRKGAIRKYFGPDRWKSLCSGEALDWGWKDPRTTITFPIWQRVFPQARYLHVIRNGVDVAISLHRRALKHRQWWKRFSPVHNYSKRMLDFASCFRLWEEYVSFLLERKNLIPTAVYMEIRYEDLLANPENMMKAILAFVEVPVQDERLRSICKQINLSRLDNSPLVSAYRRQIEPLLDSRLLVELGYANKMGRDDS